MMSNALLLLLSLPILSSLAVLPKPGRLVMIQRVTAPLLGMTGGLAIVLGGYALWHGLDYSFTLPLGLPWLPWHLRLDALAGFFLLLIGVVVLAVSCFIPNYVREFEQGPYSLASLSLLTGLFISGMLLVILANDAFLFMIAWELMSVASYFLVVFQHHHAANRRAAFLYLLMAHLGALAILLSFAVLAGFSHQFTFMAMREAPLTLTWASIAFALGVLGFGMKAGLVPLHVWLPEAHPVAPSPISALMSGVMLKVAIYGFIRLSFDLIGNVHWGWGVLLLILGSGSALFGVLYALMQTDLKRLLAYSSVENMGVVFIGLGLSMIFYSTGHATLGTLGLLAALLHSFNHALFKSLLFLGAGAILQHSHERDLEQMGGLLQRMPWTGLFFLIGCLSISALPPFNGFVSEWLTFQAALQATQLNSGVLRAIIPLAAISLALTSALTAACFVKVYGIAFLGLPRSKQARHAHEASFGMLAGQAILATGCVVGGILPSAMLTQMAPLTQQLTGYSLPTATTQDWLWLTPLATTTASYSAPWVALGLLLALLAWGGVLFILKPRGKAITVRSDAWDCGFGGLNPRMQYTATAFAMPIRQIFSAFWQLQESRDLTPKPGLPLTPEQLHYQVQCHDRIWHALYLPLLEGFNHITRHINKIQTGHLRHYLTYSFVTLLILLWIIS